ncbi:MAG: hypothetical protein KJ749_02365, partial [Planctomycetes bacterium]|nr:hypothetical protein [Planctomycetota bacterium]
MNDRPQLRLLADRAGILPAYLDTSGVEQTTKDSTRVALLAVMGFDASTEAAAAQAGARLDRAEQANLLHPVRVVRADARQSTRVQLCIPGHDSRPVDWHVELQEEGGAEHLVEGRSKPRGRDGAVFVSLPVPPPSGYHKLRATVERPGDCLEAEQSLIVSPVRCTAVTELLQRSSYRDRADSAASPLSKGGYRGVTQDPPNDNVPSTRQAFGIWTNLYTIRSRRNWGIGDLTDAR